MRGATARSAGCVKRRDSSARRLKRVAIGNMPLDPKLKSGAWRELTQDELAYLQDLCAGIEE